MKHNYQPRLKIYHKTLGKFDLIDKYNNPQSKFYNISNIKISWYFNDWDKTDLNKLLFKEFYLQQRFKYKKAFKHIVNTFFIVTLRKTFAFLYLEMLLNSYFLKTNIKYKVNVNFVSTPFTLLTVSCRDKFFNYSNNSRTQLSRIKNILKFDSNMSFTQTLVNFNYYFLPSYTI